MKEDEKVPEAKKPEAAISGPEKSAAGMDPTTTTATDKNVSAAVDPSEPVQPQDHTGKTKLQSNTHKTFSALRPSDQISPKQFSQILSWKNTGPW